MRLLQLFYGDSIIRCKISIILCSGECFLIFAAFQPPPHSYRLSVTERPIKLYIAKEHLRRLVFLGLLGVGVYNIIWTVGIHRTTAANAAILISASPIFTGIYSMFSGREKIGFSKWAGTILAFSGIFLIIYWTPGSEFSLDSSLFTGNILVLAGSILFSLYAILAKPLRNTTRR